MDFVEICTVCARKVIIGAAKRIINSDKVRCSYSDLNFGVTFFGTQCSPLIHWTLSAGCWWSSCAMCLGHVSTEQFLRLIMFNALVVDIGSSVYYFCFRVAVTGLVVITSSVFD